MTETKTIGFKWVDCVRCYNSIIWWNDDPKPTLCRSCELFDHWEKSGGNPCHDRLVRCPSCSQFIDVADVDDYSVFEKGEHEIDCAECGELFSVTTEISYKFWSPKKKEKQ